MSEQEKNNKKIIKKVLLIALALLLTAAATTWYFVTKGFEDTAALKADYTVNALALMNEFNGNGSLNAAANSKYTEKIIDVSGRITAVEAADTTLNLKIENADGAYIAFAFQQKDQAAVKNIKAGDSVSIKGSCNGASFSSILGVPYITFKRSSLNKRYTN